MINSKVFSILRSFNTREIKKFRLFLLSPYLNKSEKLLHFYDFLVKFHPTYSNKGLTNDRIYEHMYKGKKLNESTFKNLFSDLLGLLEEYLSLENFLNKTGEKSFFLLDELSNRNITALLDINLRSMQSKFDNEKAEGQAFYDSFRFYVNKFNFLSKNEKISSVDKLESEINSLSNSVMSLLTYFITQITSLNVNAVAYDNSEVTIPLKKMLSDLMKSFNFENMIKLIGNNIEKKFILEIYSALNDAISFGDDEAKYYRYKQLVEKYSDDLSSDELAFHYEALVGYCIKKSNRNNESLREELFDLHRAQLEKKLYIDKKTSYLAPELYREILITSLKLQKFDWTNEFIETYTYSLPPLERDNMYNFGRAYYSFSRGQFTSALDFLNKIDYNYFIFKYDSYNIKLKIYYDTSEFEPALNMIETFRKRLKEDKIMSSGRKRRYRNFLFFLEKAVLLIYRKKRINIEILNRHLLSENEITSKDWLVERYSSIIENRASKFSSMLQS